jgi:hypothetical protein
VKNQITAPSLRSSSRKSDTFKARGVVRSRTRIAAAYRSPGRSKSIAL